MEHLLCNCQPRRCKCKPSPTALRLKADHSTALRATSNRCQWNVAVSLYHSGHIRPMTKWYLSIPPVHSHQGDEILIHAYNGLGNPELGTSLHAHGMFFNGTSWYDGAVGVTQCSIPPGETMDYHIDTSLQTGTYWIHAHYTGQYVDGLRTRSFGSLTPLWGTLLIDIVFSFRDPSSRGQFDWTIGQCHLG